MKKYRIGFRFLTAIILVMAVALAFGCAKKEEGVTEEGAVITGKVVGEDGKPVAGVKVSVSGLVVEAETGSDGAFKLTGLPEGAWELVFEKEGYTTATTTVSVAKGEAKDAGTVKIVKTGSVSGRVLIEGETQFGGTKVSIKELPGISPVTTADDGSFTISGVAPGTYTVVITRERYDPVEVPGVEVKGGQTTEIPQVTLKKKGMPKEVVLYFSFDNIVGDKVPDESGRGYDGKINGTIELVPGKRGKAAKFAGGAFIDLTNVIKTEDIPDKEITICAWVNCQNTGGHHEIFNARGGDGTWIVHPELRGEGYYRWLFRTTGGTTIFEFKAGTVTWDTWVHFAGVYSAVKNYAALYINGEEIAKQDVGGQLMMKDWSQGVRVGLTIDNARPFTGLMDDLIVWSKALTQDEIKKVMVNGPTGI
jgi:hypothetical protein